jgi:hypothetical protein
VLLPNSHVVVAREGGSIIAAATLAGALATGRRHCAGVHILGLATAVHLVAEQVTKSLVLDVRSCTRTESKHDMTRRSVSDTSQRPICFIVLNFGVHTFAEVTARVLTFAEGANGVERAAGLVGGLAAQALGLGCGAAALREPWRAPS